MCLSKPDISSSSGPLIIRIFVRLRLFWEFNRVQWAWSWEPQTESQKGTDIVGLVSSWELLSIIQIYVGLNLLASAPSRQSAVVPHSTEPSTTKKADVIDLTLESSSSSSSDEEDSDPPLKKRCIYISKTEEMHPKGWASLSLSFSRTMNRHALTKSASITLHLADIWCMGHGEATVCVVVVHNIYNTLVTITTAGNKQKALSHGSTFPTKVHLYLEN